MHNDRYAPITDHLWIVRWVRLDGRDVKHRYYTRLQDAEAFACKLRGANRIARVYVTTTEWEQVSK